MTRRSLAAILAADVAGYSRLMSEDEAGTLAALRRLREETFAPAVAARRGRLVKSMGDGWLVLFSSAAEAAACAIDVQDRLARGPGPGERHIRLRMGVHIGDVVEENEDIYGDAVNIAARLEGYAQPGSLAISESAHVALDGALRPAFDPDGEQVFKNIDRPIRVWTRAALIVAEEAATESDWPHLTIAPVRSQEDRAELRELAAALTGDLVQNAGAPRWLTAAVATTPPEGAFALLCQLRANGDRLRLETALTAPDGAALWSDKIDGDLANGFAWQDDTAAEVAARCIGAILDRKRYELEAVAMENLTSRQCELLTLLHLEPFARESHTRGMVCAAQAIDKDPNSASAYATLLTCFSTGAIVGLWNTGGFEQMPDWLRAAEKLRGRDPYLDFTLDYTDYLRHRDADMFRAALSRALRHATARDFLHLSWIGWGYVWLGDPENALACCEMGLKLGRFSTLGAPLHSAAATACVEAGRYEAALAHAQEGKLLSPSYVALYRAATASLAQLGRLDEAKAELAKALEILPTDSISFSRQRSGFQDNEATRRLFDGLRLAGMAE